MVAAKPRFSDFIAVTDHLSFRLDQSSAASALQRHAAAIGTHTLREAFEHDEDRFARFSCASDGLLLDYSKQQINAAIMLELLALADEASLQTGIDSMLSGELINFTERRAVLHCAARLFERTPVAARDEMSATHKRLKEFVTRIHQGDAVSATGRRIRHVVHIGIGGSDLGPRLLAEAFAPSIPQRLELSFAANIDPTEIQAILQRANPEETLFIVASKSFSTAETLFNARTALAWLTSALGESADISRHFVAISNNVAAARDFGIAADAIFPMPEWVGGRFSVWSAIGLPLMLAFGADAFDEFLAGGRSMDAHFASAPFATNLPVLAALLGIWNATFLGIDSHAMLPYSHRLRSLPSYLQQLEMESNGKSVDRSGKQVRWQTAPIIFGGPGTVGQHAYHQLFYQGTRKVAFDFVVPVCAAPSPATLSLIDNALAQSAALMLGRTLGEARDELRARGVDENEIERLAPHLVCPGDQPSTTLLMPAITPFSVGQLLALYEHKVFVQGWIWGINSFDQYGVELGKNMARSIENGANAKRDGSTLGLLAAIKGMSGT